jgi:hypothetical protein
VVARGLSDWPTTCMRGPRTLPLLIASRRSTIEGAARIHVEHSGEADIEIDRALPSARKARAARLAALPPVFTCTCASIMPGIMVAAPRSITRAPSGICTLAPTSVIRSPLISTTALLTSVPAFASNIEAALMAMT